LRSSGYRWLGATTSKVLIQPSGASDSLTRAIRESIVRRGRVDSLMARGICRRLRVGALMSLHVDRWEQVEVEFNQSGKPSTTIAFQAALVDSAGRLLWSASGSELAEGPYHDASANVLGVKSSGLGQQPITGQGGPPSFLEVATSLATRLAKALPPKRTVMMDSPLPADTSRR
jgi:hypothetical protein